MKTMLDKEKLIFSPPHLGCVIYLPGLPGGGSSIHDRSPYAKSCSITGASWAKTPGGLWCLSFDGNDDVVTIPLGLDSYSSWAIELWVYLPSTGMSGNGVYGYDGNHTLYMQAGGALILYWGASLLAFGGKVLDAWNHIVAQRQGSNWQGYTNGKLDDSTASSNTTGATTLYLGGQGAAGYGTQKQALVRIYVNTTLPAGVISNHYDQEKRLF